mmetsp:Transcript_66977/g.193547  ORF Transcript_66977/g.193547 Transcript_66977/m.193547 type:complete len:110 (-) Transcript_66977:481-810(-)
MLCWGDEKFLGKLGIKRGFGRVNFLEGICKLFHTAGFWGFLSDRLHEFIEFAKRFCRYFLCICSRCNTFDGSGDSVGFFPDSEQLIGLLRSELSIEYPHGIPVRLFSHS